MKTSPLHDMANCQNSVPCYDCEISYQEMADDELLGRREVLTDYLMPNGNDNPELSELLLIERELTLREGL